MNPPPVASTRKTNPLLGPAAQLVGANIPGVPAFAQGISGGIGSMAKAAAVKMGLMAPAAPLFPGAAFGSMPPSFAGGIYGPTGTLSMAGPVAPAMASWVPPAAFAMLFAQAAMAPKKGPADYAASANETLRLLQERTPKQLSDPHFGPRGEMREGQLNTPKKMHWMLKDAIFARNRGGENLLHPQFHPAVQGLDWFIGPQDAEGPVEKTNRGAGAHGILGSQAMRRYLGFPALLPAQEGHSIAPGSSRNILGGRRMAAGERRGGK